MIDLIADGTFANDGTFAKDIDIIRQTFGGPEIKKTLKSKDDLNTNLSGFVRDLENKDGMILVIMGE